jgi:hypothetical protein
MTMTNEAAPENVEVDEMPGQAHFPEGWVQIYLNSLENEQV